MAETITAEGRLEWFSPVIPEEDYEILIGDRNINELLPLDEHEDNRIHKRGRIGPWYRLKGKWVRLTIEITDD